MLNCWYYGLAPFQLLLFKTSGSGNKYVIILNRLIYLFLAPTLFGL